MDTETVDTVETGEVKDLYPSESDVDVAALTTEELSKLRDEIENPKVEGEEGNDDGDEEKKEEASEEVAEKDDTKKEDEAEKKEATSQDQEQAQKQALEKRQKQLDGQELLVKRKISELSQFKKDVQAQMKELESKLTDDAFVESPKEAFENKQKLDDLKDQEEEISEAEMAIVRSHEASRVVSSHVKDEEWDLEGMGALLKERGAGKDAVTAFKQNPYAIAQPETIIELAKHNHTRKLLGRVVAAYQELEEKYKESSKNGKTASSDDILSKVHKTLKSEPQITAKSGGSTSTSKTQNLSAQDIANMSTDDLKEAIKARRAKER